MQNKKPKHKKKKLKMMDSYKKFVEPSFHHSNKAGVNFYTIDCEGGCGENKMMPEEFAMAMVSPIFFKQCRCTTRQELTPYHDNCEKCKGPIYLTPGAAMYKKYREENGEKYIPKQKYCETCLNEVIFTGPCRNIGCKSIGGDGLVKATFREKLFYEKKNLSYPPTNCAICREVKNIMKETETSYKKCNICRETFPTTYKKMIMILKNEEECKLPDTCPRCKNLPSDQITRINQEKELEDIKNILRDDILKLIDHKNPEDIQKAKERLKEEKEKNKKEIKKLLEKKDKLMDWFAYMVFNYLLQKKLVEADIRQFNTIMVLEYEKFKDQVKGKTQTQANKIFDGRSKELGDGFIEVIKEIYPDLAKIIKKARENDRTLQGMIESFKNSSKNLKLLLEIAGSCAELTSANIEDIKESLEKDMPSKQDVDVKVIGQSKIEKLKKTILESRQQRFESYGGISGNEQAERIAMKRILDELKEKEGDIFSSIVNTLSNPFKTEGIEIVAKVSDTKEIDSLIIKSRKNAKTLVYSFSDLIRGTLVFKNIEEWKKATNLAIEILNDTDMLISYDPLFFRENKEYLIQVNFDIKVEDEFFELQFKTQLSKFFLAIDHGIKYKRSPKDQEEEILESFKKQYFAADFDIPEDAGTVTIIEV